MAVYGVVGLFRVVQGYVGLCSAMYSYIDVSLHGVEIK